MDWRREGKGGWDGRGFIEVGGERWSMVFKER